MTGKPQTVTLNWCESCGRDDRRVRLVGEHYADGYFCTGEIRRLTYVLDGAA